jgi:hypothetical protein
MRRVLQRAPSGPRAFRGRTRGAPSRRAALLLRGFPFGRNPDSGAARLGQADRDRLLCRPGAVFALAHVVNFLAHELTGLCRRRLALSLVSTGSLQRLLLRHCTPRVRLACGQLHLLCHTRSDAPPPRDIKHTAELFGAWKRGGASRGPWQHHAIVAHARENARRK